MRQLIVVMTLVATAFGCGAPADESPAESTGQAEPTPISTMDFEQGEASPNGDQTMDFESGEAAPVAEDDRGHEG